MPEHIILKINSFYCKKLYSSAQIVEDRRFFCDGPINNLSYSFSRASVLVVISQTLAGP